jgi:hypothetical protein
LQLVDDEGGDANHFVSAVADEDAGIGRVAVARAQRHDEGVHAVLLAVYVQLGEHHRVLGVRCDTGAV